MHDKVDFSAPALIVSCNCPQVSLFQVGLCQAFGFAAALVS